MSKAIVAHTKKNCFTSRALRLTFFIDFDGIIKMPTKHFPTRKQIPWNTADTQTKRSNCVHETIFIVVYARKFTRMSNWIFLPSPTFSIRSMKKQKYHPQVKKTIRWQQNFWLDKKFISKLSIVYCHSDNGRSPKMSLTTTISKWLVCNCIKVIIKLKTFQCYYWAHDATMFIFV